MPYVQRFYYLPRENSEDNDVLIPGEHLWGVGGTCLNTVQSNAESCGSNPTSFQDLPCEIRKKQMEYRSILRILNKITTKKFQKLVVLMKPECLTETQIQVLAETIFIKVLGDELFINLYAQLCEEICSVLSSDSYNLFIEHLQHLCLTTFNHLLQLTDDGIRSIHEGKRYSFKKRLMNMIKFVGEMYCISQPLFSREFTWDMVEKLMAKGDDVHLEAVYFFLHTISLRGNDISWTEETEKTVETISKGTILNRKVKQRIKFFFMDLSEMKEIKKNAGKFPDSGYYFEGCFAHSLDMCNRQIVMSVEKMNTKFWKVYRRTLSKSFVKLMFQVDTHSLSILKSCKFVIYYKSSQIVLCSPGMSRYNIPLFARSFQNYGKPLESWLVDNNSCNGKGGLTQKFDVSVMDSDSSTSDSGDSDFGLVDEDFIRALNKLGLSIKKKVLKSKKVLCEMDLKQDLHRNCVGVSNNVHKVDETVLTRKDKEGEACYSSHQPINNLCHNPPNNNVNEKKTARVSPPQSEVSHELGEEISDVTHTDKALRNSSVERSNPTLQVANTSDVSDANCGLSSEGNNEFNNSFSSHLKAEAESVVGNLSNCLIFYAEFAPLIKVGNEELMCTLAASNPKAGVEKWKILDRYDDNAYSVVIFTADSSAVKDLERIDYQILYRESYFRLYEINSDNWVRYVNSGQAGVKPIESNSNSFQYQSRVVENSNTPTTNQSPIRSSNASLINSNCSDNVTKPSSNKTQYNNFKDYYKEYFKINYIQKPFRISKTGMKLYFPTFSRRKIGFYVEIPLLGVTNDELLNMLRAKNRKGHVRDWKIIDRYEDADCSVVTFAVHLSMIYSLKNIDFKVLYKKEYFSLHRIGGDWDEVLNIFFPTVSPGRKETSRNGSVGVKPPAKNSDKVSFRISKKSGKRIYFCDVPKGKLGFYATFKPLFKISNQELLNRLIELNPLAKVDKWAILERYDDGQYTVVSFVTDVSNMEYLEVIDYHVLYNNEHFYLYYIDGSG